MTHRRGDEPKVSLSSSAQEASEWDDPEAAPSSTPEHQAMTESAFEQLLIRMEGESIDFKGKDYPNLVVEVKKVGFIKDTICMVNTPREGPADLITGVKKSTKGQPQLWGIDAHPDDADLQSQSNLPGHTGQEAVA